MDAHIQLRNRLLAQLPAGDFARLADHLEPWIGDQGLVFIRARQPAPFVHFPESGAVSIIVRSAAGQQAEASLLHKQGATYSAFLDFC